MSKTISASLQAFLLGNTTFSRAYLISILLPNGQTMNVLDGTNVTQITYPTNPATVTVPATSYAWSPTDPTYPFTASGGGASTSIVMSPGQIITLQYASGTTSAHAGVDPVNPSGGFAAGGTFSLPAPGGWIKTPATPAPWCLIGGFANASGFLIAPPFFIGTNATIGPAPAGTTQLLIGMNDFPYNDNTGSWIMNIIPSTYYVSKYGAWERGSYSNEAAFSMSASSMELMGYIPESVLYPGTTTPLMQSLSSLVGSKVIIQALYWPTGSSPSAGFSMGTMQLTTGQIGNVKNSGRSKVICEVFDLTYILNRPFPPHMIQSSCRHSFCDSGCTLIINNFRSTPYALDVSSTNLYLNFSIAARGNTTAYVYGNLIVVSNVIYMCTVEGISAGSPPTFSSSRGSTTTDGAVTWTSMGTIASPIVGTQSFPLGYVLGITGQNAGFKVAIKAQTTSSGSLPQIQLAKPLPFAVAAGDTFSLFAGCDKTMGTCNIVYTNQIHFGGMPYVPNPEIAQ